VTWWQAVLLGALQGITEFLPISSSGHLVLAQHFLAFEEEGGGLSALFFDGFLHLGTVVAVLLYFQKGLRQQAAQHLSRSAETTEVWPARPRELAHLAWLIGLATLPAAGVAVLMSEHIKETFSNPRMVAINFLVLGVILFLTDWLRPGTTVGPATRWWQALLIGVGQAFSALFRGLSRSGMTVSAALAVGLERDWAVRFSFLMSVVASLGLGGLGIVKALSHPEASQWLTYEFLVLTVAGAVVSGAVGYLTIDPLIRLVRRAQLWWFSLYLWLVGGTILIREWLKSV
jgi:undecaprenyl-diphosphatase